MSDLISDLRPDADAPQMAEALRSGFALRRGLEAVPPGGDAARLGELGDLEGLPPLAKPGPAAPVIKVVRRVLQVFLRPWLATQTIFNRELARRFGESVTVLRDLRRRMPLAEESLQALDDRLRRIEEASGRAVSTIDGRVQLQHMFVHSRLPPPPGRVLLLGDDDTPLRDELAMLGYTIDAGGEADAMVLTVDAPAAGALQGAVPLKQLAPGGRLLAIVLLQHGPVLTRRSLEAELQPLVLSELIYVVGPPGDRRLSPTPMDGAAALLLSADRVHAAAG